jgi:hypothetical protein
MDLIYMDNWSCRDDVFRDFKEADNGCEILLACYTYGDYCGDAFVLFMQDGQLYEVNGCHCSCMGLENQWSPERTSKEALEARMKYGSMSLKSCSMQLREILERL